MSSSRRTFLQSAGAGMCAANTRAGVRKTVAPQSVAVSGHGWQFKLDAAADTLTLKHAGTGTSLTGPISFTGTGTASATKWSIQPARDSHAQRLALVNQQKNEVQGYLNIIPDGDRISLTVSPRPPGFFTGILNYAVEGGFGKSAFACRTAVPERDMVVQMASGPADSLLNDSLFDPERDVVLRFSGERVSIVTRPSTFQTH